MNKKIKIYTDGGARGNPGPAATGVVIFDQDDKLLKIDAKYLGDATNNQAEYEALVQALQIAQKMDNIKSVECYLDSELIVKQLNGIYKTKSDNIKQLKLRVDFLMQSFEEISFHHIRREFNKIADKLVNIALDAVEAKLKIHKCVT